MTHLIPLNDPFKIFGLVVKINDILKTFYVQNLRESFA